MTRPTCPSEDDLAGAAVDALDPGEERAIRRHAAACPPCDRTLAALEEAAALLGAAVPQVRPPRRLSWRVRAAAAAARPTRQLEGAHP